MRSQRTKFRPEPAERLTRAPRSRILVLTGYGVRVSVDHGWLMTKDGYPGEFREGLFTRATCGIKRLVILGHTGSISFQALKWLHGIGATFAQIDEDGTVIMTSAPDGRDDARIRRAQAVAAFTGTGIDIARTLLRRKLTGQLRVLDQLPDAGDAPPAISKALAALDEAGDAASLRMVEARAAAAYWNAWASVSVRFDRRSMRHIPDNWRTVSGRTSPLTGSPRLAANPANALFNFCYAILEAEARIALLTVGLDPGMGVLHADQWGRDSLALDVMEAARPDVDAIVLDLLTRRTFSQAEFAELDSGNCRLVDPLPRELSAIAPQLLRAVAPVAEEVARMVIKPSSPAPGSLTRTTDATRPRPGPKVATPLTQANRSAGRDGVRRQPKREAKQEPVRIRGACARCGETVPDADRAYCDACLPDARKEIAATRAELGLATLKRLRAEGRDPATTPEAKQRLGQSIGQRNREAAAWNAANPGPVDAVEFRREIWPGLQGLSLKAMADATGLSPQYCWQIRKGSRVPHPRHWTALSMINMSTKAE